MTNKTAQAIECKQIIDNGRRVAKYGDHVIVLHNEQYFIISNVGDDKKIKKQSVHDGLPEATMAAVKLDQKG